MIVLEFLGIILLFAATDVKRKPESKIERYSKLWFLRIGLVILGVYLIIQAQK